MRRLLLAIFIILLLPTVGYSKGWIGTRWFTPPAGEGILWGSDTQGTQSVTLDGNRTRKDNRTAVASGTLKKGYVYCESYSSGNPGYAKIVVYDSSGNLLATSDEQTSFTAGAWTEFTFSGANQITITSGTEYIASPFQDWRYYVVSRTTSTESVNYEADTYSDGVEDPVDWDAWADYRVSMYLYGDLT